MSAQPLHVIANPPLRHSDAIGVIDIGSNSVRLVVFAGLSRAPVRLFNEKASCALGAGLQQTGRLNPDGRISAMAAIGRFVRLARAMGIGRLDLLATAAVRDASDGPDFVRELNARYDVEVQVLSGDDEAKCAAYGVLSGTPDASGLVADLGGGSLELAEINGMQSEHLGRMCTMPLGVLRLADIDDVAPAGVDQRIENCFEKEQWLEAAAPNYLYAVGGAWRALAKLCMYHEKHPLQIMDKYTLPLERALELTQLISKVGRSSLVKIPGVPRRRLATLPLAAKLLNRLLRQTRPKALVFSVHGMREGYYFSTLPDAIRNRDPIEDMLETLAGDGHRFAQQPARLMEFLDPLFPVETQKQWRQRYAACMLGDLYWDEHPDYRGQQAFFKTLRLPVVGFDHEDRAALALIVLYRYQSFDEIHDAQDAMALLSEDDQHRVQVAGRALRLAHAMTGGAPGLLQQAQFSLSDTTLTLRLPMDEVAYYTPAFAKRLDRLALAMGLDPVIEHW